MKTFYLAILWASIACTLGARATSSTLFDTSFENPPYATGNLNGQQSWSAGSPYSVVTGGISYDSGSVDVPGGTQNLSIDMPAAAQGASAHHVFATQTDDFYFSFAVQWDWAVAPANGRTVWVYMGDDSNTAGTLGVVFNPLSGTVFTRIRSASNSNSNGTGITDFTDGQIYFIVGKVSKADASTNYNRIEIMVNPTSTEEPISWSYSASFDSEVSLLTTFGIVTTNNTTSATDGVFGLDSLRIATDYSNLFPVPEPNTAALLLLGTTAGLLLRKKGSRN